MTERTPVSEMGALPLEQLKVEAERWIPYIAEGQATTHGACIGLREIVQKAFDLGITKSAPSAIVAPIQEGWRLVPVEPSPEMWTAYYSAAGVGEEQWSILRWRAMLAAAPQPNAAPPKDNDGRG